MNTNWCMHHITGPALLLCALVAAGCSTLPAAAVVESLDERTGATLARLGNPVQLVATTPLERERDPFAFLGPFDVNRMGSHRLYLWISAPGALESTQVVCEGAATALEPVDPDALGISAPPYTMPAPWATYGVYVLEPSLLECLARDAEPGIITMPDQRFRAMTDRSRDVRSFAERVPH